MSEKNFQRKVINLLKPLGHVQKHNDSTPGIPDLSVRLGEPYNTDVWIELKYGDRPKRAESVVQMKSKSWPGQKLWLTRRGQAGGACFVLVRVPPAIMLFDWEAGCRYVGVSDYRTLISKCKKIWTDDFGSAELASALAWKGASVNLKFPQGGTGVTRLRHGS